MIQHTLKIILFITVPMTLTGCLATDHSTSPLNSHSPGGDSICYDDERRCYDNGRYSEDLSRRTYGDQHR